VSGHSKWSKIKRDKAITDAKRGKIFSKLTRIISVAAREKGKDPKFNPALRLAIEKAKTANMPNENIERAIAKGAGNDDQIEMEEFLYEAYGPGGTAILIEGITDNKNRTLTEIKNILNKNNGKLVEAGGVSYLFQRKGVVMVDNGQQNYQPEGLELMAIEAGAEDTKWNGNILEVYTKPEDLEKMKAFLKGKNILPESSSIDWVAINEVPIIDAKIKNQFEGLMEALDEHDNVNEVYSNLKFS
jgi:YebC/PmpR family DNA-binding regulatory protein